MFHVSSIQNRGSIQSYGLDASRTGAARGVAGSTRPEADGIFLAEEWDVDFFVQMNNTGGPVDVWRVDGIGIGSLVGNGNGNGDGDGDGNGNGNGYSYLPGKIPAARLSLVRRDLVGGDLFDQ